MDFVLIHGGGFAASCWDRLIPLLPSPAIAVDLPGRGTRPSPLDEITMPGVADRIPGRLARLVFVAATVPADGERTLDTLDPDIRSRAESGLESTRRDPSAEPMPPELAAAVFCNDMDDTDTAYTLSRMGPEAHNVNFEPVSLTGLSHGIPTTWIPPTADAIVPPTKQRVYADRVGAPCERSTPATC